MCPHLTFSPQHSCQDASTLGELDLRTSWPEAQSKQGQSQLSYLRLMGHSTAKGVEAQQYKKGPYKAQVVQKASVLIMSSSKTAVEFGSCYAHDPWTCSAVNTKKYIRFQQAKNDIRKIRCWSIKRWVCHQVPKKTGIRNGLSMKSVRQCLWSL